MLKRVLLFIFLLFYALYTISHLQVKVKANLPKVIWQAKYKANSK